MKPLLPSIAVACLWSGAMLPAGAVETAPSRWMADASCVIADPTSTPLNFRTAPNGRVIGNLENGLRVGIIDETVDDNGKPWVYIAAPDGSAIGWVFRRYINCR